MKIILALAAIAAVTFATAIAAMATPENPGPNCSSAKNLARCVIEQSQSGGE